MTKLLNAFWNDDDGFSAKDFTMTIFVSLFTILIVITSIMALLGNKVDDLLKILGTMNSVVITIITGVFGTNVMQMGINAYQNNRGNSNNTYLSTIGNVNSNTGQITQSHTVDYSAKNTVDNAPV